MPMHWLVVGCSPPQSQKSQSNKSLEDQIQDAIDDGHARALKSAVNFRPAKLLGACGKSMLTDTIGTSQSLPIC